MESSNEFSKMNVNELKAELAKHKLPVKGRKSELLTRLTAYTEEKKSLKGDIENANEDTAVSKQPLNVGKPSNNVENSPVRKTKKKSLSPEKDKLSSPAKATDEEPAEKIKIVGDLDILLNKEEKNDIVEKTVLKRDRSNSPSRVEKNTISASENVNFSVEKKLKLDNETKSSTSVMVADTKITSHYEERIINTATKILSPKRDSPNRNSNINKNISKNDAGEESCTLKEEHILHTKKESSLVSSDVTRSTVVPKEKFDDANSTKKTEQINTEKISEGNQEATKTSGVKSPVHVNESSEENHNSEIVYVKNLTRPLREIDFRAFVSEYGEVTSLWMDSLKSMAIITYSNSVQAMQAKNGLHGLTYPDVNKKTLETSFLLPTEVDSIQSQNAKRRSIVQETRQRAIEKQIMGSSANSSVRNKDDGRHRRKEEELLSFKKNREEEEKQKSKVSVQKGKDMEKSDTPDFIIPELPLYNSLNISEKTKFKKTKSLPEIYYLPRIESENLKKKDLNEKIQGEENGSTVNSVKRKAESDEHPDIKEKRSRSRSLNRDKSSKATKQNVSSLTTTETEAVEPIANKSIEKRNKSSSPKHLSKNEGGSASPTKIKKKDLKDHVDTHNDSVNLKSKVSNEISEAEKSNVDVETNKKLSEVSSKSSKK
ncbi:Apoptotic chromatin condensation inducer in the nucleus [Clydaea vesicula]|uniref:Apoptotic chromatin condensation inducer in the nucleus n=1 Tax=Clydaea vesicula TaxID=447962 RepID=A0AAD5XUC3_9FUNG|nr:Apoptotic chromatin condensation inducer in the nucleus [Clydaea vesicula]